MFGPTGFFYGSSSLLAKFHIQVSLPFSSNRKKKLKVNYFTGRNAKFELVKVIQNGYRMEKPDNAPTLFGEIMSSCWKKEPKDRPTFSQLQEMIGDYLEPLAVSDYLTVNNIPYEIGDAGRTDHPGHTNVTNGVSLYQPRESEGNVNFDSFDTNNEITQL
jgi:hypothetical protein